MFFGDTPLSYQPSRHGLLFFRNWLEGQVCFFWGGGSVNRVQMFCAFKLWENIVLFQRSHAPRCGGAFMWSPRCETGGQLCCYISEQQVCYIKHFWKTFPTFLKNVSVTVSLGLFLEHLLQLEQLPCPLNRCIVWVWKEEESAFFTRTWIISGESLSPYSIELF